MVLLDQIESWDKPIPVKYIARELEFIKKPRLWGTYLQGGVREISDKDFLEILNLY